VDLAFLTPAAGLVAFVALAPLAAFLHVRRTGRRARARLGLAEPQRRFYAIPIAALAATAGCLGLSAAQPVVSFDEKRSVRTDAEAIFVLDTTRSMLARDAPDSPSRLARAKAMTTVLAASIPSVPVGLASVTDRTLPHAFPTADEDVFRTTLDKAIGIERPPPVHTLLRRVTSLEALSAIATQGFFSPTARRRVLVVFTDGETLPGTRARIGTLFRRPPGIASMFVHVWGRDERVFRGRTAEPGYRADPSARELLGRLAAQVEGEVYDESELTRAAERLPELVGSGPTVVEGQRREDIALAPPLAAAALLPLALLLWRRER
jgi:hypothetical protein